MSSLAHVKRTRTPSIERDDDVYADLTRRRREIIENLTTGLPMRSEWEMVLLTGLLAGIVFGLVGLGALVLLRALDIGWASRLPTWTSFLAVGGGGLLLHLLYYTFSKQGRALRLAMAHRRAAESCMTLEHHREAVEHFSSAARLIR